MFARILTICSISFIFFKTADCAPAAVARARQFLTAMPGFVPVYIRTGDTPLEDINPDLAAAFRSYARKHGRVPFGRSMVDKLNDNTIKAGRRSKDASRISVVVFSEANALDDNNVISPEKLLKAQHIQKIKKD